MSGLNEEMNAFRYYTYYGHKKDKTLPKHLQICKASGRIFFLGNDQFYAYNENKDTLQSSPLLNQCI